MTHEPDLSKLSARLMASEMIDALERREVDVNIGRSGWQRLLEGISEGIIIHLQNHEQALRIESDSHSHPGGGPSTSHDHWGHVQVERGP